MNNFKFSNKNAINLLIGYTYSFFCDAHTNQDKKNLTFLINSFFCEKIQKSTILEIFLNFPIKKEQSTS